MFSFFRKKTEPAADAAAAAPPPPAADPPAPRQSWVARLSAGLKKTGSSITQVFTGTRIDEALYEELEGALLMADAGIGATEHLLEDLKRRVKQAKATEPSRGCSLTRWPSCWRRCSARSSCRLRAAP
jgi:fused signal recognition particle receptor